MQTCTGGWGISLLLNVVGGVLATLVLIMYQYLRKSYSRRRFRKVFGPGKQWNLVFGALSLNPEIKQRLTMNTRLRDFPLVKEGQPSLAFSAERTASACEIRAAAYVAAALAAAGG